MAAIFGWFADESIACRYEFGYLEAIPQRVRVDFQVSDGLFLVLKWFHHFLSIYFQEKRYSTTMTYMFFLSRCPIFIPVIFNIFCGQIHRVVCSVGRD
ncbi:hypothetical protein FUT69_03020 [Xylella taiwanensis]|uniref:Uncharacterized protein n=1 Tax=Xylella taiwanensis TaxID=1444770 RepID=A0ABS8TTM0_9GAMM|nr:hypothetical protein [Xylella taiwanensis]MCD8457012.1 hypothetical protein [Xylella taiwanensis]MCD8459423.1 hypothetical protein [Xylella taiwanensis]MCD8461708.1 hypothetical protein [Xylella taiwanensis]MCD8462261.1 hypothetical protein [Xylella taiwanensis]MCD8466047.1 hypothetical protein [Xylella taiwanensis]